MTPSARSHGQRVHPLTPLVKGILYLAGGTGIMLNQLLNSGDFTRSDWIRGAIILATFIILAFALGYLSWRNTRYLLAPDAVKVATGWLVRTDRSVTYARIQSVDVTEPFVARLLRLAGLRIDVAGGDNPIKLEFVRRAVAEEIRTTLIDEAMRHRALAAVPSGVPLPTEDPDASVAADLAGEFETSASEPAERVLFQHSKGRIIGAGLISSALPWSLLGLAYAVIELLITGRGMRISTVVVLAGSFGPLWTFVVGNWGLTLSETDRGLVVTRGLFSVNRESVLPGRVIGVRIREPLLWRARGLAKLELDVAHGGLMTTSPMVVVLAAATRDEMAVVLQRLGAAFEFRDAQWHAVSPNARFLRPVGWRLAGYTLTDELVVGRWGWFVRTTAAVLHAKVVAVSQKRGPLQRRLGLSSVHVQAPLDRNQIKIPHLDAAVAQPLLDELLKRLYDRRAVVTK